VGVLGIALNVRVTIAEQQAVRRANASANQTEIARCFEQARIPPSPARQQLLDLITQ